MNINLPQVAEVRSFLEGLGHAQVQQLSTDTGVPFTTLWKIRDGTTVNPGIETVRKFYPAVAQTKNGPSITETVASNLPIDRSAYVELVKAGLVTDERKSERRAGGAA